MIKLPSELGKGERLEYLIWYAVQEFGITNGSILNSCTVCGAHIYMYIRTYL